jgi:uncharacterized membrane protein
LIVALCAAVPELIDLLCFKGGTQPVKRPARTHMTIKLIVVAPYAINNWLRANALGIKDASMSTPVLLSIVCAALLFVSGWLGGQMVHVYGVGVEGQEYRCFGACRPAYSIPRFRPKERGG